MIKKTLLISGALFFSFNFASAESQLVCPDSNYVESAWGMSTTQNQRLERNLTENRNRGLSADDRISRVREAIRYRNPRMKFPKGHDLNSIAELVVWAADCTGNDFSVFSAILATESGYCQDLVGGGQDSGCSQLSVRSSAAVGMIKNQLNLRGGDGQANPRTVKISRDMILQCFDGDSTKQKAFLDYFSRGYGEIKRDLRNGRSITNDILAGAYYLKFQSARVGGYALPGNSCGGICSYNGGGIPNYYGKVTGTGRAEGRMFQIDSQCYADDYTPVVLEELCNVLGTDSTLCHQINGYQI